MDVLTQKLIDFVRRNNKGKVVKSIELENDFFRIVKINFQETDEPSGWFDEDREETEVKAPEIEIVDIDSSESDQFVKPAPQLKEFVDSDDIDWILT